MVNRYGAAVSEFGKFASDQVQVIVTLYPPATTNVTSFTIGFNRAGVSDLYMSYFVVAIGYQPQNDWVDIVGTSVPQNPTTNTLMNGDNTPRSLQWTVQSSSYIMFADLTDVTFLTFITSIKTLTYSSLIVTQVQLSAWAFNATHFTTKVSVPGSVGCKFLVGFVLFYRDSEIDNEGGFYKDYSFDLSQNANTFLDLILLYPSWGPSFSTKCFFGFWEINYHLDADINFRFYATVKGNYHRFSNAAINRTNTSFKGAIFCLANHELQCGENQNFYDKKTGLCYTASGCPVTTPDPGNAPPLAEYCKLCVGDECIDCVNSNRSHCTECDLTKHSEAINGSCVCIQGYHRPSTVCVANCTYHLPGCLLMNCTSTTFCNQCSVGYYLNLVSGTVQNCIKCSDAIPNCLQCGILSSCGLMCQPYCSRCDYLYGETITQECDLCSSLISHCLQCSDNTYCDKCEENNLTYHHWGICLKCTDLDPECNGCSYDGTGITCTSCQVGYYLDPVLLTCEECSLAIQDCQQCIFNVFANRVECTLCSSIYLVDDNFTCEKCKQYQYVTGTCSNISGCASSHLMNGVLVCLSCDATLHFAYNTVTQICQCKQGFLFNSIQGKCFQICGDGTRESMQCDDGNLINYDGCSQTCKVQESYSCNDDQGISVCTLNQNFTVVYDYMLRHLDENKVSLYFTVTPPSTALNKVDWLKTITFNFSEPVSLQVSYQNGILIVTLQYTSDIEDKILNLDITFNSTLINSQPQSLTLKMNAINGPLTYSQGFGSFKAFKYTGLIIGIICLLFYLISSYFHKMIGLQTIQFIQLIYFSRLVSQNANQSSFYGLNSLKYSNGYNEITSGHTSVETYKSLQPSFIRLELSLYFLDNCNLMLIPIFLASIGYVWFSVKKSYHRSMFIEKKQRIHQDKYTIANRKVDLFYDNLIFSFTLSLMYVTFFSTMVYLKSNQSLASMSNDLFRVVSLGINLLVLFYLLAIFTFESIEGIKKYLETLNNSSAVVQSNQKNIAHDANKIGNGFHPLYVPVYLFYQLILIVVMNLIFTNFQLITETLLTVCVLYLLLIIYWKPYQLNFHNYAIMANQITVVFFVGVLTLLRYKLFNSDFLTAVITLTLVSISISTVFQIVRLFLHRKLQKKLSQQSKAQQLQQNKDKLKGLLNQHNPFLLQNQIKAFQQTQKKRIQKNLFGKYHVENYSENYKRFFLNKKNLTIKLNNFDSPKKISSLSVKTINSRLEQTEQKQSILPNNQQEDSYLQELNEVKYRLKRQLNHGYK